METAFDIVNVPLPNGRMRASRRFDYRVDVVITAPGANHTIVLESADISQDGLFVEAPVLLDEGTDVGCTFPLPDGTWFEATGQVVRVDSDARTPASGGMGIEFVDVTATDRIRLRGALALC